ncbi:hypothetical protein N7474_006533 [Penicillium riverlandense]|uniref:uncharacterized protein n=1 Tax=Penicillium riverlandense TaxID=1903569 RepID=UPI0025472075|nr:uncharacterized protein N7474_006533 [Penicillium riverlandense]KAJ5814756.1 hypothetical protein N7474_006533 [Penicillium riverlandense]
MARGSYTAPKDQPRGLILALIDNNNVNARPGTIDHWNGSIRCAYRSQLTVVQAHGQVHSADLPAVRELAIGCVRCASENNIEAVLV